MLRDQLICGINDKVVQQCLQSELPLSFEKVLSLAQGLETAAQNDKELHGGAVATSQMEVHKVTSQLTYQNKKKPARARQPVIGVVNNVIWLLSVQCGTASPSLLAPLTQYNRC